MKIQFLESSKHGLLWMRKYYNQNPQLNHNKAFVKFLHAQDFLCKHPSAGHKYENFEDIREFNIAGSSFSILYTHRENTIYVIDIRDQRGLRSSTALKEFNSQLRKKYNL